MTLTFVLAIWIGIESLGIDPTQSYDFNGSNACEISIVCGSGVEFTDYSSDIDDLGSFTAVIRNAFSITAWDGHLDYGPSGLVYTTETGYSWGVADLGHFLFLRAIDGSLWIAIEDMPEQWGTLVSDHDYNDALYRIDPMTPVPEPGSLMLMGTGLLFAARKFRKKKV